MGDKVTAYPNSGRSPRRPVPVLPSAWPFLHNPDPYHLQWWGVCVCVWTPRSKSKHISQFFQSAKKLYKHREASPFLNSSKRLPRMFYNAQFSFLFYFFIFKQYHHKRVRSVSKKKRRYKELVSPGKCFLCQLQNSHQSCVRSLLEQHQMLKCLH